MKHSDRRQMMIDLASWLAAPLGVGIGAAGAGFDASAPLPERKSRLAGARQPVRPRIAAPKGSVMRRG